MMTTQNMGALVGAAGDQAQALDPNAPVELPRRCGLCAHFRRLAPLAADDARLARWGNCAAALSETVDLDDQAVEPDRMIGDTVGDLFGCVRFEART